MFLHNFYIVTWYIWQTKKINITNWKLSKGNILYNGISLWEEVKWGHITLEGVWWNIKPGASDTYRSHNRVKLLNALLWHFCNYNESCWFSITQIGPASAQEVTDMEFLLNICKHWLQFNILFSIRQMSKLETFQWDHKVKLCWLEYAACRPGSLRFVITSNWDLVYVQHRPNRVSYV